MFLLFILVEKSIHRFTDSPIHQSFVQRSDLYKAIFVPKFLVDLFDTLTLDFGLYSGFALMKSGIGSA
jgi:hypothetical protein